MTTALHDQSLGDLVLAVPASAALFDRLGLDYCCHGERTLGDACAAAELDVRTVEAALDVLGGPVAAPSADLPPAELADHIVATHHRYLRDELPLVGALGEKVLTVHGERHPELAEVRRLVAALTADLLPHLDTEEQVLFPAVAALAGGGGRGDVGVADTVELLRAEHEAVGELLAALRRVTDGYQPPADGCASYRSLYERLAALELDTHRHIHLESHVLFPAAVALSEDREQTGFAHRRL